MRRLRPVRQAAWMMGFALLRNGPDLLRAILLFYFRIIFDRDYPMAR